MFYAIVDSNKIESCANVECDCLCSMNIIRYNTDKSKAIVHIYKECSCCNCCSEYELYTKASIEEVMKKNDEWRSKNIV